MKIAKLFQKNIIFMCCDIQTGFIKNMFKSDMLLYSAKQLTKASKILETPIFVTEQYPKVLFII
jgi:hypothetical protein